MKTFEPNKTITELGIDTTRKFVVVDGINHFQKGDILTLREDDNSTCPYFKNENGGFGNIYLKNLAYYEEMKEGDYVYVSDESEEDALERIGKRILLKKCSNGVVCVEEWYEEEYLNGRTFEVTIWKYAVPIPKTKTITIEVTEEQDREINKHLTR